MKRWAVFAVMFLLVAAGAVCARNYEVTKKAGEYTVDIKIDKNPPSQGKNDMEIAVKDKAGKAVTDAKVLVEYVMPPMPGMAPMNYKTGAELKGETYRATMDFSMAGPWNISVKITRADKTQTARFTVDVK